MDSQQNSQSVENRELHPITEVGGELDFIFKRALFWRPTYLAQSSWLEHIPFAFWLVETLRPRNIIELGTHYGSSYFSFCQAVTKLDLETCCFAVDTWGGDEHAGQYGEEVYKQVSEYNRQHYSGFSTLIRSTFDQALDHFSQGSIDLLHIDGLHTFDAVRHDFESWLPKLSEKAVVIMHDTNVRERGFGVFQLLDELKQQYPHFEFAHGHGLGIIGVGSEQAAQMQNLYEVSENARVTKQVQDIFYRLGKSCGESWENCQLKRQLATQQEELRAEHHQLVEKQAMERGYLAERITAQYNQLAALESKLEESKVQEAELIAQQQCTIALRSELALQQQQAMDTQAQLVSCEQQREEVRVAKQALDSALTQATQQLAQTAEELTQLAQEKQSLLAQQAESYEAQQAFQRHLEQKQEHTIAYEQARHQLQQQLNDQALQLNEETLRTAQLTLALGNSNLALTEGARQLADLQHQLEQSLRAQHTQSRSLAEQDDTIRLLQERAKALLQELHDEMEAKIQLQRAYSVLESQRDVLDHERDALYKGQLQLNEKVELGRLELQMLQQQQAALVEEFQQLQNQSEMLSRDLVSQREQHDVAQYAWQQQEQRLNTVINEQQQQIDELNRVLGERFNELATLTHMLEEQEQSLIGSNFDLLQSQTRNSELQQRLSTELSQYQQSKQVAQQEWLQQQKMMEERLSVLTENNAAQEITLADRFRELAVLTNNFENLTRELQHKEEQLQKAKERVQRLKKTISWKLTTPVRAIVRIFKEEGSSHTDETNVVECIISSGLFNEAWYCERYPEVINNPLSAIEHYLEVGAKKGYNPSPKFDTNWYINTYPDVAKATINPLLHYIMHGHLEHRKCLPTN